jgi:hypothetical protein
MYQIMVAVVGLSMLARSVPASADRFECEAARISARAAGGPISEYDAWLLEQDFCGCEPGSKIAFCERLKHRQEHGWYRQNRYHRRDY